MPPRELRVRVDAGTTTALMYPGVRHTSDTAVILAHGAGAGQRSPFMVDAARRLAAQGLDVVTFNFLYTEQRRRIPDRAPTLEACFLAVFDAVRRELSSAARATVIGGKSMGGRIATQLAAAQPDLPIAGVVLLGYPLHPPGKPDQRRDAHLPSLSCPVLFVQGSRDAFGTPGELEPVLSRMKAAMLHVVAGGDHSFKPRGLDDTVVDAVAAWIAATTGTSG